MHLPGRNEMKANRFYGEGFVSDLMANSSNSLYGNLQMKHIGMNKIC